MRFIHPRIVTEVQIGVAAVVAAAVVVVVVVVAAVVVDVVVLRIHPGQLEVRFNISTRLLGYFPLSLQHEREKLLHGNYRALNGRRNAVRRW